MELNVAPDPKKLLSNQIFLKDLKSNFQSFFLDNFKIDKFKSLFFMPKSSIIFIYYITEINIDRKQERSAHTDKITELLKVKTLISFY